MQVGTCDKWGPARIKFCRNYLYMLLAMTVSWCWFMVGWSLHGSLMARLCLRRLTALCMLQRLTLLSLVCPTEPALMDMDIWCVSILRRRWTGGILKFLSSWVPCPVLCKIVRRRGSISLQTFFCEVIAYEPCVASRSQLVRFFTGALTGFLGTVVKE